jgi:hypothetical protein
VTGYLDRLAARLVEPRSHIRPRPVSRFEAVDPPAAFVEEVGAAEDTLPAPPTRAQPPRAADDRGRGVGHFASSTPPLVKSIETPADTHTGPVANLALTAPSALDAQAAEAKQVRAPSRRHDPLVPMTETVEASERPSPASHRAMPAAVPALAPASPTAKDVTALPPAIEGRISPWRAPVEHPAEPAIESRTTAPGPLATTLPRQSDKPDAEVDGPSVVQVTIGRLEVRAPEAPRRPAAKPPRAAPRMSLQDYLQRRSEGRAR